jgi:diguanylate cyclase (GGDEF)-like protein/PAS domain S-box-containing protein
MSLSPSGSALRTIRLNWPVATVLVAGTLASLWAAQIGWQPIVIVFAGLAVTGIVARLAATHGLSPSAQTALEALTKSMDTLPDGVLTLGAQAPEVAINQSLVDLWNLPSGTRHLEDPNAILAAVLGCVKDADRLRADIALLERAPETPIHREVDLNDGRVFDVNAGSMESPRGRRFYFVFHDVSQRKNIEQELHFANTLLRTQLEASPLGIMVVNSSDNVVTYNQRFVELSMMPAGVFAAGAHKPILEGFADQVKDTEAFLTRVRYLYAHMDEPAVDEFEMKDGRVLERHSVELKSPDGHSFGRVWFFSDITAIRTAERVLREERDFVDVLLDSLPGYFVLITASGRLVRWNESLRTLNGLTDEQITGANPFANVVDEDRDSISEKIRETLTNGSATMEFRIHSKLGVRDLRWQARRLMIDGKPHALAIGIDVTEVHESEALRRAGEKRFRDIFESATEGILIQDAATSVIDDVNPRLCEMFGYSREELLERDIFQLSAASPADVLERRAAIAATEGSQPIEFEWLFRGKSGREFWCDMSSRHIANFDGRPVFLSMIRDITERRQARDAIAYRDRILHAVTLSTAELVRASSLTASMTTLLKSVGEELGVDRLMVIQRAGVEHTSAGASIVYGWQRDGVAQIDLDDFADPANATFGQELAAWLAPLAQGQPVRTYAATATGMVREIFSRANIVSNLQLPITIRGAYWGQFGVDDTHVVRDWNAIELDALQTLADVVGSLIERERTASALVQSEEQFRTVSDTVPDAIIMIGADGRIRYWNRAAERIFGYSATEAYGKPIHDWLASARFRDEATQGMTGFVETGRGAILGKTVEMTAMRKDGVEIAVELSINPMNLGSERYAVGIVRDVTARNQASRIIERMATHDLLTDLPNRRFFIDSLDLAIGRSKRSGQSLAVLYLDLDRFKDINDTLGHPVGDRLLQAVAARLRVNVREIDTVARFGGDEFAAIQIDIREPADAAVLAEKLVNVLEEPFDIDGNEIRSGTSLGIAVYGPDSPDAEALLAHADVALYRAKSDGRGTYRFYTESMDIDVRERVTLENELRDALTLEQLVLLYQPQIDVTDGHIVGLEARVRWLHPTRGIVKPERFIPLAEKSGLIVPLGTWILREACRQTKCWIDAGIAPPLVGVNLSALQFKASRDLEQTVASVLEETRVPAAQFELELTEDALMEVSQQQNDVLLRLRALGFRIAIDDFGNGYSSLARLRRFPVDRIKIAQTFVADLGRVPETGPIVRATIALAHALGIAVIAEGVETATQLELLKSWGCTEGQGPYFSEPLSATDASAFLRTGSLPTQQRAPVVTTVV